jgi:NAD(P)H-hydrate epimerase
VRRRNAGTCDMRTIAASSVPTVTADQMREIDRIMIEELNITLLQMMENAGRNLADLALARFCPSTVTVLAGSGGNGGGGLVAARHLANRGVRVRVVGARPSQVWSAAASHQRDIVERMGISVSEVGSAGDLIIDALIGYSLRGCPAGRTARLVAWANAQGVPVLALDTPTGLDVTTGRPASPCVEATATMTLALPKPGLIGTHEVGELYVADISVPPAAYRAVGIGIDTVFSDEAVVRLDVLS